MPPGDPKRRFQFSIRWMLAATAVIAVGFSVGCIKTARLEDGLFAAAATCIVAGLINQIIDLYRDFRQTTGLSSDHRSGWWFAMLWRAVLAIILVGHFYLMGLLAINRVSLAGTAGGVPLIDVLGHEPLRKAIFALSLLLVFGGLDGGEAPSPRRKRSVVFGVAIILLVVPILLLDRFFIPGLVHIVCAGMAMSMHHPPAEIAQIYSGARSLAFLGWAAVATGLVVLDLILLRQVIALWSQGWRARTVAVTAVGLSLVLTALHPVWLAARGLKDIAPCFAETFPAGPLNRWLFGLALAMLFVTAVARRMILSGHGPARDPRWNWRRRPETYFHERRLVAFFVAATIAFIAVRWIVNWTDYRPWAGLPGSLMDIVSDGLENLIADPITQLWLAVFCVAVYRVIFGVARTPDGLCAAPREMSCFLFAVVWIGLLATVVLAAPIVAALGFGMILNWWRVPL
jgi:hypothetical protein